MHRRGLPHKSADTSSEHDGARDSLSDHEAIPQDSRWLVRMAGAGGMALGPMSWSDVQEMLARGEARIDDLVCSEGSTTWQDIESATLQKSVVATRDGVGKADDDATASLAAMPTEEIPTSSATEGERGTNSIASGSRKLQQAWRNYQNPASEDRRSINLPPDQPPADVVGKFDEWDSDSGPVGLREDESTAMEAVARSSPLSNPTPSVPVEIPTGHQVPQGDSERQTPDSAPIEIRIPTAETTVSHDVAARDDPQYFIQCTSGESGPLPRNVVQELVYESSVSTDTCVRLEWTPQWSTATALGFTFPTSETVDAATESVDNSRLAGDRRSGTVLWLILAPAFYLRTGLLFLRSLSWQWLALLVVACCLLFVVTKGWVMQSARTALSGTVTLDSNPLSNVTITFSGLGTGQVVTGISDQNGRFRLMTIDGQLTPGTYRVIVRSPDGEGKFPQPGNGGRAIPVRYGTFSTSDASVRVLAGRTQYDVVLTTMNVLRQPDGP